MIYQATIQTMIEDEDKASRDYAQLAKDNPKLRAKLMKISKQEAEHARFWRSM